MSNTGSSPDRDLPRIALSAGEPAGVGPDLLVLAAQQSLPAQLIAVTDPDMLQARARQLGRPLLLKSWSADSQTTQHIPGELWIDAVPLPETVRPGYPDAGNVDAILTCLRRAVAGCQQGTFDALVTAPVHKAVINSAGISFPGHTEFIAHLCAVKTPVMLLANETLRVALVTTHLPLKDVAGTITAARVVAVIGTVARELQLLFRIAEPRLLVLGLNPHAGEGGYLGQEEIEHIAPAVTTTRARGIDVTGPVPADTAFTEESLAGVDAVVAMYHDQGLPALKARGFGSTVNITLGLPILRTSVDHGTALELAGSGRARADSLLTAIHWTLNIAKKSGCRRQANGHGLR